MLSDFTPIIHRLDGRTIRIYCIADVHLGAKECDLPAFKAVLRQIQADSDAYLVIAGDLISNGLATSKTNVYEELIPPSAQIDLAVELLTPVKDKILGAVSGNHEFRSKTCADLDPLYTVFCIMGIQALYRQNFAFVRVNLERGKTKDHYALMLIHGKTENKRKQFEYGVEGVDAIISGHVHCGSISKPAKIVLGARTVKIKPVVSVVAASFLQWGGYASRALYKPTATVTPNNPQYLELEFTGTNARDGNIRVVW
jgi:UDP-2,3-diacylglucosamine pyrophosphatase LpxH